jgi:hypothetical protein
MTAHKSAPRAMSASYVRETATFPGLISTKLS